MIKLSNAVVVANTREELTALEEQLAPSYPEFLFETIDNVGDEKDSFPFRMLVTLDNSAPDMVVPNMPTFFNLLLIKIDQLNQQG